ncbi:cyclase [Chlorobaculum sp. 24CR]|uniref:SRPBCC family protein n=1 Tax=Chlorobaculum sp. 24CR TaxID=2508878 RepID=UPI00100C3322|nr:SRPBCC family protein [Chlorobaculum sp. 24CR]RXK88361.1 cyclase [Chlorobaculum sp. 24CR]
MNLHTKTWVQRLPVPIDVAWDFFSQPDNLARITPPEMFLRVDGGSTGKPISEGMQLSYTLYPFMMIPVRWTTEIMRVSRPDFFEDRQLEGPYELWHHTHRFREIEGGTEMTDIVEYALPFDMLGEVVEALIVGRRLDEVFEYRRRKVAEILGAF